MSEANTVQSSDGLSVRRTILSEDRKYRYTLWREWTNQADLLNPPTSRSGRWPDHSYAMFVGLNPSTADETQDDPTIRKCIGFAKRWGFSGLLMTNLFAFRATRPEDMMAQERAVGEMNMVFLHRGAREAGIIVAAWGTNGSFRHQDRVVENYIKFLTREPLVCLRTTKEGCPEHPLYVPYETPPKSYVGRTDNSDYPTAG